MTKQQYDRSVWISERLDELEKVKDELKDTAEHRLWYANKLGGGEWMLASEWKMRYIDKLLDKHDLMIRQEIDDEIEKLKKEIETL